jgi:exopolyphosphatase/guanosine-5'-triphosphate,3'-diphosphate pyrophosphatase
VSLGDQTQIKDGELMAAVDMGSNSFHMVVARMEHGEPRVIDRLRDSVRMAAGLRADGTLDAEHRARALNCLARFGQRIAGIPTARVRAVATNTVRRLAAPQAFLTAAETALGHPVEVVSGREEGRLIFLGVAHDLSASREPRLVIDIGGGSTEFIIGRGLAPMHTESVQVGCIATTHASSPVANSHANAGSAHAAKSACCCSSSPRNTWKPAGSMPTALPAAPKPLALSCRR